MALEFRFDNVDLKGLGVESAADLWIEDANGSRLIPLADAMVWLSMFVGYPKAEKKLGIKNNEWKISEDNYKEYAKRIAIWEKLNGPLLRKEDKESGEIVDRPILEEDVKKFIGMWSNGGSKSRAEFNKDIVRVLWEKADEGRLG